MDIAKPIEASVVISGTLEFKDDDGRVVKTLDFTMPADQSLASSGSLTVSVVPMSDEERARQSYQPEETDYFEEGDAYEGV